MSDRAEDVVKGLRETFGQGILSKLTGPGAPFPILAVNPRVCRLRQIHQSCCPRSQHIFGF